MFIKGDFLEVLEDAMINVDEIAKYSEAFLKKS
jgi:hypothetical protein